MKTIKPAVAAIPDPQHRLAFALVVRKAAEAIDWYCRIFGAVESFRLTEPSGKVGHAELDIGGSLLMLADEYPDFGALGPVAIGGTPVCLHLYVEQVDQVVAAAVAAGATLLRPVTDEFYGDRVGMIVDPYGHKWQLASRIEQVSPAEMQQRWTAMLTQS